VIAAARRASRRACRRHRVDPTQAPRSARVAPPASAWMEPKLKLLPLLLPSSLPLSGLAMAFEECDRCCALRSHSSSKPQAPTNSSGAERSNALSAFQHSNGRDAGRPIHGPLQSAMYCAVIGRPPTAFCVRPSRRAAQVLRRRSLSAMAALKIVTFGERQSDACNMEHPLLPEDRGPSPLPCPCRPPPPPPHCKP